MKHMDIYKLWDSIGEMALDLNESAIALLQLRTVGELPDRKHDNTILARALYKGVRLRQAHLDALRDKDRTDSIIKDRRGKIADLIYELGGANHLAQSIGRSPNALRVAQHRGKLPAALKYEIYQEAQRRGVALDMTLFDDPVSAASHAEH